MKYQIRRGCFETNSSSTHSLQVVNGSIDDAMKFVNDRILKSYKDRDSETNIFDFKHYLLESNSSPVKFNVEIKGIDFADGDENSHAYSLVTNWMAKIQYIGMILDAYKSEEAENRNYWDWFETKWGRNSWNENYGVNQEYMKDLDNSPEFFESQPVKWFKEWVKTYIENEQSLLINDVLYDSDTLKYEHCFDRENSEYMSAEILNNKDLLFETLNKLMQPDYIMIYADEAYSPYYAPSIKVY